MARATAIAKQNSAFSFRTLLMMAPVIAGLSNPELVSNTMNMVSDNMQSTVSAQSAGISGFANTIAAGVSAHAGFGGAHSSPLYVGGGQPIFLSYNQ